MLSEDTPKNPADPNGEVRSILVDRSYPNDRLDSWLSAQMPGFSRSAVHRLIDQGFIRINGHFTKPTHYPRAGELIEIMIPQPKPSPLQPQPIPLDIIYEDRDVVVINKPPGLVVHPSAGHDENTIVNALLHHCNGELSGIGGVARPGIVHRLDRDTSGCMVVAKNDQTHTSLAKQFASRTVNKIYWAIVVGVPQPERGEIVANIARHPTHRKRMAVTDGTGRSARTSYRTLETLNETTLVEATLHTGRTHQIRVHFKYIGFPLVGDATYGKRQNNRLISITHCDAPRQMLHAYQLRFNHPITEKELDLNAPPPADFQNTLSALRPRKDDF